jgi:hypothetical protein
VVERLERRQVSESKPTLAVSGQGKSSSPPKARSLSSLLAQLCSINGQDHNLTRAVSNRALPSQGESPKFDLLRISQLAWWCGVYWYCILNTTLISIFQQKRRCSGSESMI